MREIRTYGLMRGRWPVRHSTAGWGLLNQVFERAPPHPPPAAAASPPMRGRGFCETLDELVAEPGLYRRSSPHAEQIRL